MARKLLILETSDRVGRVALAQEGTIVAAGALVETRRLARDLAPAVAAALSGLGWTSRELQAVMVSRGPGSYTGLRVGIMSAKTLAYATGCTLLGIDTFAAIASQAEGVEVVDVLADAQQDRIYVQRFRREALDWRAAGPLSILPFQSWLGERGGEAAVTGPGLRKWLGQVPPGVLTIQPEHWDPRPESLLRLGLVRLDAGERDDPFALEPLYLRPSSAEEQWARRLGDAGGA